MFVERMGIAHDPIDHFGFFNNAARAALMIVVGIDSTTDKN